MPDPEILLTAVFLSAASAVAGIYLVLGRQSMYGDALSHGILPGIVMIYLITGERSFGGSLLGAVIAGIAISLLIERLKRIKGIPPDAAIGTVFVVFFAFGIVLISGPASGVDLDQECVLFGEIAFVPFERISIGSYDIGAKGIWVTAFMLIISILFQLLFGKIMSLTTFQPEYAQSIGINPRIWHLLYSIFISVMVVLAFELVGVILVISLLVSPIATAWLFSRRLSSLLMAAVGIAVGSSTAGVVVADMLDVSISGLIAVAQGFVFFSASIIYYYKYTKKVKKIH